MVDSTSSPDGLQRAELVKEDATSGTHSIEQVVSASATQTYTFSVYLKAAGANAVMLYLTTPQNSNNGVALRVDLSSGAIHSAYKNGTATFLSRQLQPLYGGWYRLSVTGIPTATAGSQVRAVVYLLETGGGSASSYPGNGSDGVHIWGAQLERDTMATVLQLN